MFIQTEATPNPATLKFLPGEPVLPGSTRDYRAASEAVFGKRVAQPAARERRSTSDRRASATPALPAGCR